MMYTYLYTVSIIAFEWWYNQYEPVISIHSYNWFIIIILIKLLPMIL